MSPPQATNTDTLKETLEGLEGLPVLLTDVQSASKPEAFLERKKIEAIKVECGSCKKTLGVVNVHGWSMGKADAVWADVVCRECTSGTKAEATTMMADKVVGSGEGEKEMGEGWGLYRVFCFTGHVPDAAATVVGSSFASSTPTAGPQSNAPISPTSSPPSAARPSSQTPPPATSVSKNTEFHCALCRSTIAHGSVFCLTAPPSTALPLIRSFPSSLQTSTQPSSTNLTPTTTFNFRTPPSVHLHLEPICTTCFTQFAFCTECGGGGRYRTGKWRPRGLFRKGRRTCSLSHVRVGSGSKSFIKVLEVGKGVSWDELVGSYLEMGNEKQGGLWGYYLECLYSTAALPEVMGGCELISTYARLEAYVRSRFRNTLEVAQEAVQTPGVRLFIALVEIQDLARKRSANMGTSIPTTSSSTPSPTTTTTTTSTSTSHHHQPNAPHNTPSNAGIKVGYALCALSQSQMLVLDLILRVPTMQQGQLEMDILESVISFAGEGLGRGVKVEVVLERGFGKWRAQMGRFGFDDNDVDDEVNDEVDGEVDGGDGGDDGGVLGALKRRLVEGRIEGVGMAMRFGGELGEVGKRSSMIERIRTTLSEQRRINPSGSIPMFGKTQMEGSDATTSNLSWCYNDEYDKLYANVFGGFVRRGGRLLYTQPDYKLDLFNPFEKL
ncbi:hypothetical protein HDV05_000715 [Chytridiales sp. JEL 0842]|nr:hypothetical protein HDV05_000715 [Chytridiales sp. JEL 0842]